MTRLHPASKRVLPGEEIGGYKLDSIGVSNVVIEWQEKKFTLDISESARHVPGIVERSASAGPSPAPVTKAGGPANQVTTVAPLSRGVGVHLYRRVVASRRLSRRPGRHCCRRKEKGSRAHSFRHHGPVAGCRTVRLAGAATNRQSQQVRSQDSGSWDSGKRKSET